MNDDRDPIDADLRAAFGRLRHDTAQVDTMNALRNLEDGRGPNPWKMATLALGGGVAAVLVVLGALALRNDDEQVDTAPAQTPDAATEVPTDAATDVPTAEAPAPTETATDDPAPTEAPTDAATDDPAPTEAPTEDPAPTEAPPTAPAVQLFVAVSADGLALVPADGSTGPQLPFGTDQATVLAGLQNALGEGSVAAGNPECPNQPSGTATWDGILSVEFRDNALIGWSLPAGSSLTTLTGVGLGSTIADLRADYPDATFIVGSTLGDEFVTQAELPALVGLTTGPTDADTITNLWAGEVCIFR